MSRPPRGNTPATTWFSFRANDEEAGIIERLASLAGLSKTEYCRHMALRNPIVAEGEGIGSLDEEEEK